MSTGTHTPEVPDSPGVYQIRCKRNGKFYVGSAVNLRTRWDTHRRDLRRGSHHNPYLQLAWKLYGEINFELVVLPFGFLPHLRPVSCPHVPIEERQAPKPQGLDLEA